MSKKSIIIERSKAIRAIIADCQNACNNDLCDVLDLLAGTEYTNFTVIDDKDQSLTLDETVRLLALTDNELYQAQNIDNHAIWSPGNEADERLNELKELRKKLTSMANQLTPAASQS